MASIPTPSLPRRCAPARRQRGAALLTAMVIVTLVTTIAASMVWQQWRAVQVESAERGIAQSYWMLAGAMDWARLILRTDKNGPPVDHLGEQWAVPLAEARLSTFLAVDQANTDDAPEAYLSGRMTDISSRFNLMTLIDTSTGEIAPDPLVALQRLCGFAGLSSQLADGLAKRLQLAWLAHAASLQQPLQAKLATLGGQDARAMAPLFPQTLDQLTWLGLTAVEIERLRPFVVILVDKNTFGAPNLPINVNTAAREVIAAVVPGMDLGRADRLVQMRQRKYFENVADAISAAGLPPGTTVTNLGVESSYFEIEARLRLEDRVIQQRYVVEREGRDVRVQFEDRYTGIELPAGTGK